MSMIYLQKCLLYMLKKIFYTMSRGRRASLAFDNLRISDSFSAHDAKESYIFKPGSQFDSFIEITFIVVNSNSPKMEI